MHIWLLSALFVLTCGGLVLERRGIVARYLSWKVYRTADTKLHPGCKTNFPGYSLIFAELYCVILIRLICLGLLKQKQN